MRTALRLAARGLGRVWPNPAVGCVLIAPSGRVVGRGWTQPGGRPHAEREALEHAGAQAVGATAYVTLEPCSHHGKTPPCADALIAAGVTRVVVALGDPDPRVNGRGIARLKAAGLLVQTGLLAREARDLNLGFLMHRQLGRPMVTLKVASSLDGRIATASGESQWITGPEARAAGHWLRATHDAIAIGRGTLLADDPVLTCRLPGLEDRSPVRVVFDARLDLPTEGRLARSVEGGPPLWLLCAPQADPLRRARLEAKGVRVVPVATDASGHPDVDVALATLAGLGITRLLLEGGSRLAATFLAARRVDRVAWFRAPSVVGGDGIAGVAPFGVDRLTDSAVFSRQEGRTLGNDWLDLLTGPDPLPGTAAAFLGPYSD
ncbi:riboflavin biosynthesis protein RibD [Pararhodospirillum oryzae]|uniref:Riboflavin biosynthesis protein RibD n=2 Tax=Pararhodospirillum oryzae TaxID=478448 RepID=A0A512HAK4_9PROT|nr:bifunctional diaminohydroxyphosphoribosylaminopyrimidine deaminase/5-amino-6-(5-phosphoribosylamino)uracil reductase RibD [Pararhodospirillum oryzae]GEO82472.1 riboflavin biosynthesis protein RibD [Pararhodospirillum oryzae]